MLAGKYGSIFWYLSNPQSPRPLLLFNTKHQQQRLFHTSYWYSHYLVYFHVVLYNLWHLVDHSIYIFEQYYIIVMSNLNLKWKFLMIGLKTITVASVCGAITRLIMMENLQNSKDKKKPASRGSHNQGLGIFYMDYTFDYL